MINATYALVCEGKDEEQIHEIDRALIEPSTAQTRQQMIQQASAFSWAND